MAPPATGLAVPTLQLRRYGLPVHIGPTVFGGCRAGFAPGPSLIETTRTNMGGDMGARAILCGALMTAMAAANLAAGEREVERDEAFYQKTFEQLAASVVDLEKRDVDKVSAEEIETIRTLIGQGQAFLANEKLKKIEPLLERAEALVPLARARQSRVELERKADQAEREAVEAEGRANESKEKADATEQRYNELEEKGL